MHLQRNDVMQSVIPAVALDPHTTLQTGHVVGHGETNIDPSPDSLASLQVAQLGQAFPELGPLLVEKSILLVD
ncbi:hypothetical protein Indivirus_1_115 [Indivirus ILV1]|uniref:Uncharacterized protein n=1 Tax=Indivirus ILV1 TaxID=1977633 RepID=A0A1V0SCQ3_9VIRU|nr:hypothetical protein Indivirus_1_115 [Indivirus ILV1]